MGHTNTTEECFASLYHLHLQVTKITSAFWWSFVKMGNTSSRPDFDPNNSHTPKVDIAWMAGLSHDTKVCELSIPGTHQSVCFKWGPPCVCQSWPLLDQLYRGIRFVDIRFRHYRNGLQIHHDRWNQGLTFQQVIEDCLKFLDDYPSETILMRVKQEHTAEGNSQPLMETFKKCLVPKDRFWLEQTIPNMRQVRGKIVILRNFAGDKKVGYPYSKAITQDEQNVKNCRKSAIDRKWKGNILYLRDCSYL